MSYVILIDYRGSDGHKWLTDKDNERVQFPTVDDALQYFLTSYASINPFEILRTVDWQAVESGKES